jgi:PKD repeat protein
LRDRTPIDAQLELVSSAGSILMLVDDPSATSNTNTVPGSVEASRPFSPSESILCRATYSGRYYARVLISPFAVPPTTAGDYLLSITRNGFVGAAATNRPPSITSVSVPPVEGSSALLTAAISDLDAGAAFSVFVDWGDGSSNAVPPMDVCQDSFQAAHLYPQAGSYPVTVTVQDIHGASASTNTTIQVVNAVPARIKAITYASDGSVQLDLEGSAGASYRIEVSETLQSWTTLATRTADALGQFQLLDAPPLPQRRFYRAVWP